MVRRNRAEMIEDTRARLLAAGREAFTRLGYAQASMDDFTAGAGLTRGALYHHFGDKKGLLAAVVEQIDAEMEARLSAISDAAPDQWEGFWGRCRAFLQMAQEKDIQRIVLQEAPAVLGAVSVEEQQHCIASMRDILRRLQLKGVVRELDAEALARLVYGALTEASLWIARAEEGAERLTQSLQTLELMLQGVRVDPDR